MSSDDSKTCLADCLAFLNRQSPDIAIVVTAWPTLPAAIQAGIVAMVKAVDQ